MFIETIQTAAQFTRPIHTTTRFYGSTSVDRATVTLFFVNAEGWPLTCKRAAENFVASQRFKRNGELS